MKITTLVENTTVSKVYKNKHGLSLHIKTNEHSILFDLGPDDTFLHNARKLNIDISDVDIVIISHGHLDHGGGLKTFLKENKKAKIYINKNAFEPHFISIMKFIKHYIGLDKGLEHNDRIVFTEDYYKIDDNLLLFSNIKSKELTSASNRSLLKKERDKYVEDDFDHEQSLIIKEDNKNKLICGCSHCGMNNIINEGERLIKENIHIVIGGMHLFNPTSKKSESEEFIKSVGDKLGERDITYFTCHCTGVKAFDILRNKLGSRINYLSTGEIIEF